MKHALVIYNSKTGTTEQFAAEIGDLLSKSGIGSKITSIFKFNSDDLVGTDLVLIGCWTSGLMVILQHPERTWVEFAKTLPDLHGKKIVLFTTYAIATGSMFRNMRKHIRCQPSDIVLELKSRNGQLDARQRDLLSTLAKEVS
jgi:flavodoxin